MLSLFLENQDISSDEKCTLMMNALDLYIDFIKELSNIKKAEENESNKKKEEMIKDYMKGCNVIIITVMTYDL